MTMHKSDSIKKKFVEILAENLGIITTTCKKVGVARSTFYKWYGEDPEFKKEVDDVNDQTLDFVEEKLHDKIKEGDTTSIIFYCKTKGKRRGYVEKQITEVHGDIKSKLIEWNPATDKE